MLRQRDIFLFTSSAPVLSLFSAYDETNRRPVTLLASVVLHALVGGVVSYGILNAPAVSHVVTDRYSVRHLDLRTPQQQRAAATKSAAAAKEVAKALPAHVGHRAAALQQAIQAPAGPQTLLQPDLPLRVTNPEIVPVPRVLIWTPPKQETKEVVAPRPAPVTSADSKPSLDTPTPEINLADLDIAASALPTQKLAIMPSTTTPIQAPNKSPVQLAPSATTQPAAQPTPTAVLSISDLQMNDGTATLPPINESVHSSAPGALTGSTGKEKDATGAENGSGSGADQGKSTAGAAKGTGVAPGAGLNPEGGAGTGTISGENASTTQITLPRDGRYGVVVVGQNTEDQYPELSSVWSGRMAYTVYLHVGLARSWILQYSLPANEDAAVGGDSRLDAPWPYTIIRPNLTPGEVNADALMVHGYVNQSGRFENLSMVFPQACPAAPFILKSLEQWQFRPALQNGQVARVEVLLIIPEELE